MVKLTEAQLFAACTPDLASGARSAVRARIACPETGGIKRVRLGMNVGSGRPAVVWCSRYGNHPVSCKEDCLQPDAEPDEQ